MDKTLGAGCKNDSVACMIETDFWKLQWLNNDAQIFVESTNIESSPTPALDRIMLETPAFVGMANKRSQTSV